MTDFNVQFWRAPGAAGVRLARSVVELPRGRAPSPLGTAVRTPRAPLDETAADDGAGCCATGPPGPPARAVGRGSTDITFSHCVVYVSVRGRAFW